MVKEKTKINPSSQDEEKSTNLKNLVIFNDDINTFNHVIDALVDICNHEPEQAEQCAIITHYKGKCSVKSGTYETLKPKCEALLQRDISAEIE